MKAWQLIKRYGWTQHWAGNTKEGFCIMGAAMKAYRSAEDRCKLYDRIYKETGKHASIWNDSPVRTKKEVIELLKQVEAKL